MAQQITFLGGHIQTIRKKLGLTQEGLAELMGDVSRAQIASYESGKNQPPWSFIVKFVRVCNSSYEEVFDGKTPREKVVKRHTASEASGDDLIKFINELPLDEEDKNRLLTEVGKLYQKLNEQKDRIMEILVKRLNL